MLALLACTLKLGRLRSKCISQLRDLAGL